MRIYNRLTQGLTDYLECDRLQRETHEMVAAGKAPDTLIISQFAPVYTAGRATKPEVILNPDLHIVETDRGGSITWHGPGQVVIYPIVKLADPTNTIGYIRAVEASVLGYLKNQLNLPVCLVDGRAGIWWKTDNHPDRKLCAIGLKIARGATMHGLALNVNPDMSSAFSGIIPCGLDDAWVCTLADFGIETTLDEVASGLISSLQNGLKHVVERPDELNFLDYISSPTMS